MERVCAHAVACLSYGGLTLREPCCLLGCIGLLVYMCVSLCCSALVSPFCRGSCNPRAAIPLCIVCSRCSPLLVGHQRGTCLAVLILFGVSCAGFVVVCRPLTQHVARCLFVPHQAQGRRTQSHSMQVAALCGSLLPQCTPSRTGSVLHLCGALVAPWAVLLASFLTHVAW